MNQVSKTDRFLFYFAAIDILFAPYFPLWAIATSQFFVFFWFLIKGRNFCNPTEVKAYWLFLILIVLSNIVSLWIIPYDRTNAIFIDNWKRGINIGVSVSYYFLFSYYFKRVTVQYWKWLFALVIFMLAWALLYYFQPNMFFHYKEFFNSRDATMSLLGEQHYTFRFNFIWTDPNNVGYAIIGVITALTLLKSTPNFLLVFAVLAGAFVVFMTMSYGSLICGIIFIPIALLIRLKNNRSFLNILTFTLFGICAIYMTSLLKDDIMDSDLGISAQARYEAKEETGDDRPKIWKTLLEHKSVLNHAILGEGSNIFVENEIYSPHSGHLMLIFSYGVVAYLLFMYLIFRKPYTQSLYDYLASLPFLFCFTSNIGIGEIKFVGVLAFIVASSRCMNSKTTHSPTVIAKQIRYHKAIATPKSTSTHINEK